MFKKMFVALAGVFMVLGLVAAPASAAPESSALTGQLELYAQPNFGGTAVTSTDAQGFCVKPRFTLPGGATTNIVQSARIVDIGAGATMVADLMSGGGCGGTLTLRVTSDDDAPVVPAGTVRSVFIVFNN